MTATQAISSPVSLDQLPFASTLAGLIRATDSYGTWDKKSDADLLDEFIVTKEQRREIPIIGDPDPDIINRVEQFYRAVGLRVEKLTGFMCSPMMQMSHEGFGRVLLSTGRLVVFSKTVRDVHRFGFVTMEKLDADGEKIVTSALDAIKTYPDVARD